jgi:hypothetical protein
MNLVKDGMTLDAIPNSYVWFPTVFNTNVMDAQTCEVGKWSSVVVSLPMILCDDVITHDVHLNACNSLRTAELAAPHPLQLEAQGIWFTVAYRHTGTEQCCCYFCLNHIHCFSCMSHCIFSRLFLGFLVGFVLGLMPSACSRYLLIMSKWINFGLQDRPSYVMPVNISFI